jgi:hypothetical protein
MRFSMTAKALLRQQEEGLSMHELTALNMRKVTRYRKDGEEALEAEVQRLAEEKSRIETEEKEAFEKDGTQWEWVRDRGVQRYKDPGPGRVHKRMVRSVQFGADPDPDFVVAKQRKGEPRSG